MNKKYSKYRTCFKKFREGQATIFNANSAVSIDASTDVAGGRAHDRRQIDAAVIESSTVSSKQKYQSCWLRSCARTAVASAPDTATPLRHRCNTAAGFLDFTTTCRVNLLDFRVQTTKHNRNKQVIVQK